MVNGNTLSTDLLISTMTGSAVDPNDGKGPKPTEPFNANYAGGKSHLTA